MTYLHIQPYFCKLPMLAQADTHYPSTFRVVLLSSSCKRRNQQTDAWMSRRCAACQLPSGISKNCPTQQSTAALWKHRCQPSQNYGDSPKFGPSFPCSTWKLKFTSIVLEFYESLWRHCIRSNFLLIASGTMFRSNSRATPSIKTTPCHAPHCAFWLHWVYLNFNKHRENDAATVWFQCRTVWFYMWDQKSLYIKTEHHLGNELGISLALQSMLQQCVECQFN